MLSSHPECIAWIWGCLAWWAHVILCVELRTGKKTSKKWAKFLTVFNSNEFLTVLRYCAVLGATHPRVQGWWWYDAPATNRWWQSLPALSRNIFTILLRNPTTPTLLPCMIVNYHDPNARPLGKDSASPNQKVVCRTNQWPAPLSVYEPVHRPIAPAFRLWLTADVRFEPTKPLCHSPLVS